MQPDSERDLIPAWQEGDSGAARQIVAMLQAEAIYVSYLLTGERDAAIALAETGFLSLLEQTKSGDPDIDQRVLLLNLLGQEFMRGNYRDRVTPDSGGLLLEPAPARFHVDDRKTLLLAALGRLDARERAMLVLRDFSGLEWGQMARLQERRGEVLVAPLATARDRVRQSLDIAAGEPLRPAFVEATFSAPRTDIWSRIEDEVLAILQRSRKQSRLISAAIIAVVAAILIGGTLALLGGEGDRTSSDAAGSLPDERPTSLPAGPTVGQSIVMEPTSTPEPGPPHASVPSWLLVETTHLSGPGLSSRSLAVLDPATGQTRRLPSNTPLRIAAGADQVHVSPDGFQMVLFREEVTDEGIDYFLTSYSTDSIGRQWESAILTLAADDGASPDALISSSHIPVRLTSAVTGSRVYAALLTTGTEPRIEIHSFFSRNGMPRGSLEIELPRQTIDTRIFRGNILLHAPPQSDRLYLLVESFGDSADEWRATLMTFDRNDLALISERSISADPSHGYWLWSSQMTADGTALYGVHENRSGNQVRVQFLEFETGEIISLSLPFNTDPSRLESVLTVPSHDGKSIYVLDRTGNDVAVVDLGQRRIERVFPLDRDGFDGDIQFAPGDRIFGYGSALSTDGSQIFIAAWNHESGIDRRGRDGIWVIDTTTWRLTGFVPLDGLVSGIFLSPANGSIYAQVWTSPYSSPDQQIVRITTGDHPIVTERADVPHGSDFFTLSSPWHHYIGQFGKSPAIDYVGLATPDDYTTLPRIEVTSTPSALVAGQNTTIEIRFLDPLTGEPVTADHQGVRFDSQGSLTATLRSDGHSSQIIILGETRQGVYRGTTSLPEVGTWEIDATITSNDGAVTIRQAIGQVVVAPAFTGSDGRSYAFRISTDPETPVTNELTVLRLELVDTATGNPLPPDVDIELTVDGMTVRDLPDKLDVPLVHDEPGSLIARMNRNEVGVYTMSVRFWASGTWHPTVRIHQDDGPDITIPVNTIEVRSP